jgi:microcystin-dependent protein
VSDPFLSEIKVMSFGFAPRGWALCNGQIMSIAQNQALFSLIGNRYGGDGRTTFALPNLQGRIPMHAGNGHSLAGVGGEQAHILTLAETPTHSHLAYGTTTAGDSPIPAGNYLGGASNVYGPLANTTTLDPSAVTSNSGGQAHNNLQPYTVLNFCIAIAGIFPSRS